MKRLNLSAVLAFALAAASLFARMKGYSFHDGN
jgi:hypothetical protein